MASIINAPDLPSEDEEDQDYDPTSKEASTGYCPVTLHTFSLDPQPCTWLREEESDGAGKAASRAAPKRGRGVVAVQQECKHDDPGESKGSGATIKDTAKKAKINALWEQLKQGAPAGRPGAGTPGQLQSKSIAALCRSAPTHSNRDDKNRNWMKQLGFAPRNAGQVSPSGSQGCPPTDRAVALEPAHTVKLESQQNGRQHEEGAGAGAQYQQSAPGLSAAAAALAAAKAAASSAGHLQAVVTETRRFAGKDIQMTVSKAEADAEKQARNKAGLDAVLASLQAAKKANVLDKSRSDWTDFKHSNTQVDEELEKYKKSGDKYLDKVDFLKRTELKEYEKERDARLGGDIRSRGRL